MKIKKYSNKKEELSISNKKRIDSLKLRERQYNEQQHQIKLALAEIDNRKSINKKILFESDEEKTEHVQISTISNDDGCSKSKLFDDSDSDGCTNSFSAKNIKNNINEENVFNIKPQFEGKKGQKLLALQSNFKTDERFRLDERFIDSDDDDDDEHKKQEHEITENMDVFAERKRNFEILQNVLDIQYPSDSKKLTSDKICTFKDTDKLRYDPNRDNAKRFETRKPDSEESCKKKKKSGSEPIKLPEVSKEKYFEVLPDLKDIFNHNSGTKDFSILKQFGNDYFKESDGDRKDKYNVESINKSLTKLPNLEKNVFKYDSSDNEDDNALKNQIDNRSYETSLPDTRIPNWHFFFKSNDSRLKEGVAFFQRKETNEEVESWWTEARTQMLDIIHTKLKTYKHRSPARRNKWNKKK